MLFFLWGQANQNSQGLFAVFENVRAAISASIWNGSPFIPAQSPNISCQNST